jgi:hypothetical protein
MSTRCIVIRPVQAEGRTLYQANYIHSDGYPGATGWELNKYYSDATKRDELFALGWLSSLGPEIGEPHDFEWRTKLYRQHIYDTDSDPRAKMCLAYHRDRGDKWRSDLFYSLEQAASALGWGYLYLWNGSEYDFYEAKDGEYMPYVETVDAEE